MINLITFAFEKLKKQPCSKGRDAYNNVQQKKEKRMP